MNILHINEQISSSLSTKLTYYMLDEYLFMMHISKLASGMNRDKLPALVNFLSIHKIAILVMYEANASAVVLDEKNERHEFDLLISFNEVMDIIPECRGRKIHLSKSNWERNCKAVDMSEYKIKLRKFPVIRGILKYDLGKKLSCNYLSLIEAKEIVDSMTGVIGSIVQLHYDKIEAYVLWEEDMVFGIKLKNGKYICFNCNPDTYSKFRNLLWPQLKQIVDDELEKN